MSGKEIVTVLNSYKTVNPEFYNREVNEILSEPMIIDKTIIIGLLDYTNLNPNLSREDLIAILDKISLKTNGVASVAGLCINPKVVGSAVSVRNEFDPLIKIVATPGGFPKSTVNLQKSLGDIEKTLQERSDEVDVVFDTQNFLQGNYIQCIERLRETKNLCLDYDVKLKVILETSVLGSLDNVQKASFLAIASGADFLKTSTGTTDKGAQMHSFLVMVRQVKKWLKETNLKVGVKPSGGIGSYVDCVNLLSIVGKELGPSWLEPDLTRVGASKILDTLLDTNEAVLIKDTGKFY